MEVDAGRGENNTDSNVLFLSDRGREGNGNLLEAGRPYLTLVASIK